MTFDEYQTHVGRTAAVTSSRSTITLGLMIEAAECGDLVKKFDEQGRAYEPTKMAFELGDVLFYLTMLAVDHGFDLATIAEMNVAKLRARYPAGFVPLGGVR